VGNVVKDTEGVHHIKFSFHVCVQQIALDQCFNAARTCLDTSKFLMVPRQFQMIARYVNSRVLGSATHHFDCIDAVSNTNLKYSLAFHSPEVENFGNERGFVPVSIVTYLLEILWTSRASSRALTSDRLFLSKSARTPIAVLHNLTHRLAPAA